MSWLLVFWLVGADGKVFAHDSLHGFASKQDCELFAGAIPVKHGIVRWECKPEDKLKPAMWYHDGSNY
jgi:hypothetical protein